MKLLEEHREDCLGSRSALRRFCTRLKKGDYFFLPACAAGEAIVEGELELLICRGGIEP